MHTLKTVAVWFLIVTTTGCAPRSKDRPLEVYPFGSEQRILDFLEAPRSATSSPASLNILDHAYAVVIARAFPKPDESSLVTRTVAAICEEFQHQTGTTLPADSCQRLTRTAARAGRFEDVLGDLQTQSPHDLDRERLIDAGLAGMLSGPQPPAWLVGKDEAAWIKEAMLARKEPEREEGFVGLNVANWPTVNVVPGGPAEKARLKNGDVIVSVDGQDVSGVRSAAEAMRLFAGPVGGNVSLEVRRGNEKTAYRFQRTSRGAMSVRAEMVRPGILYISIPTLEGSGIASRVKQLLCDPDVANQALVLDLRDNPGGRLEETNAIGNVFLDRRLLEIIEFRDGRRIAFRSAAGALQSRAYVLVNRNTGSSAEILAMALRDNSAATIVGEPTTGALFGKDIELLKDGRALIIRTSPQVLSPTNKDYSRGGITPDISVRDNRNGSDEILEKALQQAMQAR